MWTRQVVADKNNKLLYVDANNLYSWAMMQMLPSGNFEYDKKFYTKNLSPKKLNKRNITL
jgi:hypothetical protein